MAKAKLINEIPLPFPGEEFAVKWEQWMQYRREARLRTYVPTGLKMTFTKLVNDSGNDVNIAIKMIDQALAGNWQGIFPLKNTFDGTIKAVTQKPISTGNVSSGGFGQL